MIYLVIGFCKHSEIYALVITVLCLPLAFKLFRAPKKHPVGTMALLIFMLMLWAIPVEGMMGRHAVRRYNQALPQPREITAIKSEYDAFYGGTYISVKYADDPQHEYNYVYSFFINSISEDEMGCHVTALEDVSIRPDKRVYPVGVTEVSGEWIFSASQRQYNKENNYDYRGDGGLFILERYCDDWQRYGYEDVGFYHNIEIVKHGGKITFSIYPTYVDDNGLPAGRYRIVKPIVLSDTETGLSASEEFDTYCYFEVK